MKLYQKYSLYMLGALFTIVPKTTFALTCTQTQIPDTVFSNKCLSSYKEWINFVWNWGLSAAVPLSIAVLTYAGILYASSGGSPEQMTNARKIITAVFSGLAVLIAGKAFLAIVLGV